jgi:membrane protease YdiL (CAAX protease family)
VDIEPTHSERVPPEQDDQIIHLKPSGGASSGRIDSFQQPSGIHSIITGPGGVRAGWRALAYAALFFLFLTILQGLMTLIHNVPFFVNGQMNPTALFLQEIAATISAIAAALVMGRFEDRRFAEYGMPPRSAFRGLFWQGAAWGFVQNSVLVGAIVALGGYSFEGLALDAAGVLRYALFWAVFFIFVGLYEEFFFRGYLHFTAASGIGFWPAAFLMSAVFGAAHMSNPGESPIGLLDVFLIGLFFSLTLRRTGNLWFAIGFHASWDFAETFVFSLPNSGIMLPGQLLRTTVAGPDWLTGGSVGPEGSVVAVVVIAIGFVVFDRVYRPRGEGEQRP